MPASSAAKTTAKKDDKKKPEKPEEPKIIKLKDDTKLVVAASRRRDKSSPDVVSPGSKNHDLPCVFFRTNKGDPKKMSQIDESEPLPIDDFELSHRQRLSPVYFGSSSEDGEHLVDKLTAMNKLGIGARIFCWAEGDRERLFVEYKPNMKIKFVRVELGCLQIPRLVVEQMYRETADCTYVHLLRFACLAYDEEVLKRACKIKGVRLSELTPYPSLEIAESKVLVPRSFGNGDYSHYMSKHNDSKKVLKEDAEGALPA